MRPCGIALLLLAAPLAAEPHLSRFGEGEGPREADGVHHLLDAARSRGQSNAVAFDRTHEGARESVALRCRLRVLEGGDGGAFLFLSTAEYGARGPAPFVRDWTAPNLRGTFAVGVDVHDPPNDEPFGPWGNVQGLPEREVSLHWDGREIVKRLAPEEFRGDFADCEIALRHVIGGAEATVRLGGATVYDRFFVPGLLPYESRLAIGAGTRADAATEFDVSEIAFEAGEPAAPRRAPLRYEVFHHVLTDNSKTAFEAEVDLPPPEWALGRVILTLDIHDAGEDWDEWDRCGEISVLAADGTRHGIVPFITSYRTPCHWEVDVTHFRPWLAGRTRLEVAAGTNFYKNRGYRMSVALEFHHGTPELEPWRVIPLWNGTAHYRSPENRFRDFFTPRTVEVDAEARAARVFLTTTGHSQVGEFTPSKRTVVFAPANGPERRFESVLWKTDCYLNPNRPQYGTWKYPRAGWAPGDVVRPWWIDLTGCAEPGTVAELRYEPEPYELGEDVPANEAAKASQVVRSYLILWRAPAATTVPAPALRVTDVVQDGNAAKAGVKPGDFLLSYDGRTLDSRDDLLAAIDAAVAAKKEQVELVVYRGPERLELALGPGRMGVGLAAP